MATHGHLHNIHEKILRFGFKVSTGFFYDREISKIDRMMAKIEESIERLQEYCTALIAVGVTEKIGLCGYGHTTEAA